MKNRKRTFSDLKFADHNVVEGGVQATLNLGNDLEASVVSMKEKERFGGLYGNASEGTYEVAVFRNGSMLPLNATDDVRGWQTEDDLNNLFAELQSDDFQKVIDAMEQAKREWNEELLAD
jgi:hypothetical protein